MQTGLMGLLCQEKIIVSDFYYFGDDDGLCAYEFVMLARKWKSEMKSIETWSDRRILKKEVENAEGRKKTWHLARKLD